MSRIAAGLQGVVLALVFAAGAAPTGALSQGVINIPRLSASLANELVGDTVAICAKKGYKVWAVVVNLDGVRQAVLRGDGADPLAGQRLLQGLRGGLADAGTE